jgi:hypothetical protein
MRLFKAHCPALLLTACAVLFGPCAGFAQSNGDQFESDWSCEYVTDYAQFCDFVIGVSSLAIDATGSITTSATTEGVWGFLINLTQCQDGGDGNCSMPFEPSVSTVVITTISPDGTSGSGATSGSSQGEGEVQVELPTDGNTVIQADQTEATYTETSQHSASFAPPYNEAAGQTSTDVAFDGPWFLIAINGSDGFCGTCSTTVQRTVGYQIMTYSGNYAGSVWVCE